MWERRLLETKKTMRTAAPDQPVPQRTDAPMRVAAAAPPPLNARSRQAMSATPAASAAASGSVVGVEVEVSRAGLLPGEARGLAGGACRGSTRGRHVSRA